MAKTKTGLGKGLDLLIPGSKEKEEESGRLVKTSLVEPNPNQPRKQFDKEKIEELAKSIKEYGIIQPIIVCKRDERYEIIAGERRWRAAKKAGLKEIPVVVKEYSDKEIAEISLIENIQREDLNPIEEAKAFKQLIDDYNLTQEELASRISKSRETIANTMRLLKLHPDVQKLLADGKISAGHARALLGLEDQEDQAEAVRKVIEGGLSVRQTEDLVRFFKLPSGGSKAVIKNNAVYKDLEKKMTAVLGTKVRIKQKAEGRGTVEISYFSEEQLDEVFLAINRSAK